MTAARYQDARSKSPVALWLPAGFRMLLLGALTFLCPRSTEAICGLGWNRPVGHFDGIDEQGHLSYVEEIGTLELDPAMKLPIYAIFNSNWETVSPYLGKGWHLALLESRFEQVNDNNFRLLQPDGWYRGFGRANVNETVLGGAGGWKAEIKGERIDAYADCGWKLSYLQGRIVGMTLPDGRQLRWVYDAGRVAEVVEGNITRLKVLYNSGGQTIGLETSPGELIAWEWAPRPRVRVEAGQRVRVGFDPCVAKIKPLGRAAKGGPITYNFGVDENLRQPTLQVTRDAPRIQEYGWDTARTFTWDAATKFILKDGRWNYQIKTSSNPAGLAAVERKTPEGLREYYERDDEHGREQVIAANGISRVTTRFSGGVLAGKTRKIEETFGKATKMLLRTSYDGFGRVVRVEADGTTTNFRYDQRGNQSEALEADGATLRWKKFYDGQNRLQRIQYGDGKKIEYSYKGNGDATITLTKNGSAITAVIDKSGKIIDNTTK